MTRYLLLALFFVMLTSRALGLDISLAPGLSTKNALLYLIAGFVLIESAVARNRKLEMARVLVPFCLLFSYAFATWLLIVMLLSVPTYSPIATLISLKGMLLDHILLLFVFFYGVNSLSDSLWLVKALTWCMILVNVTTLLDMWNTPDLGLVIEHSSGRAAGIVGNPNDLGALLAFFLPLTVALFLSEKGTKRSLAMIGVLATTLLLLMTVSRGALLGVVVGSLLATVYLRRFVPSRIILHAGVVSMLVGIIVVAVLVTMDYGYLFESRLQESASGSGFDRSAGRTFIWWNALEEMLASPWSIITGFGWGAHSQSIGHRLSLHSTYITYLFELGVIGLALLLTIYFGLLSTARDAIGSARREARPYIMALVYGVLAFMVAMIFNDLHVMGLYTWSAAGIVLRLSVASFGEARNTSTDVLSPN